MDQEPLVKEEIDAGAEFARAFDQHYPVKVAFWLKVSDQGQRRLYIASDLIDDTNFDVAYLEVIHLTNQTRFEDFDPFQVKVLNAEEPLAKAAVEYNERFPRQRGTRLSGRVFGGVNIDSAYIYPSPLPASAV